MRFKVKISVLEPEAKTQCHPRYRESTIVFDATNCSVKEAVESVLEHKTYKAFCEKNGIGGVVHAYYTDAQGNWQYYGTC